MDTLKDRFLLVLMANMNLITPDKMLVVVSGFELNHIIGLVHLAGHQNTWELLFAAMLFTPAFIMIHMMLIVFMMMENSFPKGSHKPNARACLAQGPKGPIWFRLPERILIFATLPGVSSFLLGLVVHRPLKSFP